MMMSYLLGIILLAMALVLLRALRGPTRYDRMLAANAFGTKTMILTALLALVFDEPMLIDIALVYAMINFITTVGLMKYARHRDLGLDLGSES